MTASEVARLESLDADRIGRPESPWRALERRFTGRYPIDAFGLDPQLSDLLVPLFTFAVRVEVEGEEHVPASGPAVIVANRAFGLVEPAVCSRPRAGWCSQQVGAGRVIGAGGEC